MGLLIRDVKRISCIHYRSKLGARAWVLCAHARVTVIPIWHLFRTIQLGSSRHHTAGGCIPQHQDDWNMTRIATWWSSHEEKLTEPFTQIQMRMGDAEEVRGSEALKFLVLANVCPGLVLGGGVRRPKLNCNIWMLEWQELRREGGSLRYTNTPCLSSLQTLCDKMYSLGLKIKSHH